MALHLSTNLKPALTQAFASLNRRGFAAAASAVSNMMRENRPDHLNRVNNNKNSSNKGSKSSWMPDPVTGYYLPEDHFGETDVAQLREELLNQKGGGQI
ncbi:hypothetical protein AMTRI_Chr02g265570 [Amborella trichopoda]|uniref:Uncharacterized protein n=1 Tax=Amborella trichopoda TaxID=13333 RepID=W1P2N9_AMBTC|nr:late embryogenesis abundant protein Lea5 [Amborella trichopoda]ERN02158.1 hypothetical protein AMTR_s00045p00188290 [Amborella trichopoda]|eukprot:XP_006840483.1 late embryogenesis abundant protein Lea5 [Amborella trichopoda]